MNPNNLVSLDVNTLQTIEGDRHHIGLYLLGGVMNQIQGQARTRWAPGVMQTHAHGGKPNADAPTHIDKRFRKLLSPYEPYIDGSESPS